MPTTYYQVGSALLKKEVVFEHYSDRLLIRYTLEETHSPQTLLRLRPYLAFRSVRAFTHANGAANTDYTPIAGGIKMRLYDGYPYLCMQISKRNTYVHQPDWYRNTFANWNVGTTPARTCSCQAILKSTSAKARASCLLPPHNPTLHVACSH